MPGVVGKGPQKVARLSALPGEASGDDTVEVLSKVFRVVFKDTIE